MQMQQVRNHLLNKSCQQGVVNSYQQHSEMHADSMGNTYKARIQPISIIQKRAMHNHLDCRSHTKTVLLKLKTVTIADLIKFKSMVLM